MISVWVDEQSIGRQAAETLLAKGHRRLGFAGKQGIEASRERLAGFVDAAKQQGAEVVATEFKAFQPSDEMGAALDRWRQEECTAVFSWTDEVACYLYKAAAARGLRVPEDLSVIGVNDTRAGTLRPGLTTFALPLATIGARAADLLLGHILTGVQPGEPELYQATLIQRKSVSLYGEAV